METKLITHVVEKYLVPPWANTQTECDPLDYGEQACFMLSQVWEDYLPCRSKMEKSEDRIFIHG